jgi:ABC-type glycerol-3-phosphate transport system substrate-binding protein
MTKQTFKNKLDNYWYYYKTHFLIGILIIAAIILLSSLGKSEKPSALNVVFIGNGVGQEEQTRLQKAANSAILKNSRDAEVKLQFWSVARDLNSPQNIDLIQKLFTQISTKDIDVLVVNKNDFLTLARRGAFLDLKNNRDFNQVLTEQTISPVMSEDHNRILGIELNGNPLLSHEGFRTGDKVIGILSNTQHKETANKFVQWFIKQK